MDQHDQSSQLPDSGAPQGATTDPTLQNPGPAHSLTPEPQSRYEDAPEHGPRWKAPLVIGATLAIVVGVSATLIGGTSLFRGSLLEDLENFAQLPELVYDESAIIQHVYDGEEGDGFFPNGPGFINDFLFGRVAQFNGRDEFIQVHDEDNEAAMGNDDFALTSWIKSEGLNGRQGLVSRYDPATGNGYYLFNEDGRLGFGIQASVHQELGEARVVYSDSIVAADVALPFARNGNVNIFGASDSYMLFRVDRAFGELSAVSSPYYLMNLETGDVEEYAPAPPLGDPPLLLTDPRPAQDLRLHPDNTISWSVGWLDRTTRKLVGHRLYIDDLNTDDPIDTVIQLPMTSTLMKSVFTRLIGVYNGTYVFSSRMPFRNILANPAHRIWYHDLNTGQNQTIFEIKRPPTPRLFIPAFISKNTVLYSTAISRDDPQGELFIYDLDTQEQEAVVFEGMDSYLADNTHFSGGYIFKSATHTIGGEQKSVLNAYSHNGLDKRAFYLPEGERRRIDGEDVSQNGMVWRERVGNVYRIRYCPFQDVLSRDGEHIGCASLHTIATLEVPEGSDRMLLNPQIFGNWVYWVEKNHDTGEATVYRRPIPEIEARESMVEYVTDEPVIARDVWSHVAVTVDRDKDLTLYVNGEAVGAFDVSRVVGSLDSENPLVVGKDHLGHYSGYIRSFTAFRFGEGKLADFDPKDEYWLTLLPNEQESTLSVTPHPYDPSGDQAPEYIYSINRTAHISIDLIDVADGTILPQVDARWLEGGREYTFHPDVERQGLYSLRVILDDVSGNTYVLKETPFAVVTCEEQGFVPTVAGRCVEASACSVQTDCPVDKTCRPPFDDPVNEACQEPGLDGELCNVGDHDDCGTDGVNSYACDYDSGMCRVDGDDDDVADTLDNCPLVANPEQTDRNNDGIGDACDVDDDGFIDHLDNCPVANDQADTDGDGEGDACDDDIDGDNFDNDVDLCPNIPDPEQGNVDGDAFGDLCDTDIDGDGLDNASDICPFDSNADQSDQDGNGVGDVCDNDIDGDTIVNDLDNCPLIPNEAQRNMDDDAFGDVCDDDTDGDELLNEVDNCPNAANPEQENGDGDAFGDVCDDDWDSDEVNNDLDNCPLSANEDQSNMDGDLFGDVCDDDTDGDELLNEVDNCPVDANEDQANADLDGLGDVCDDDIDGDLFLNEDDVCPTVADPDQADGDGDLIGDLCDDDWDNDLVLNGVDVCPLDADADQADLDGDGDGDVCDDDVDGDDVADDVDNCPNVGNADQLDSNGSGKGDLCEDDFDNDGVLNAADNCPESANADQSNIDGDLFGDSCDLDADGDSFVNDIDACPLDARNACGVGPVGAACIANSACESGLCLSNVCAESQHLAAGDACSVAAQCSGGLICSGGVCRERQVAVVAVVDPVDEPVDEPQDLGNAPADEPDDVVAVGDCPAETLTAANLAIDSANEANRNRIQSVLTLMKRENPGCPDDIFQLPEAVASTPAPTGAAPTVQCFTVTPRFDVSKGEKAYFSCVLGADVDIFKLSVDGQPVADEAGVGAGLKLTSWDGKSEDTPLTPGSYDYTVRVRNSAGEARADGVIQITGASSVRESADEGGVALPADACEQYFVDITGSDPDCAKAAFAREEGWFFGSGLGDRKFIKMNNVFNRIEFATVLARVLDLDSRPAREAERFSDVSGGTAEWQRLTISQVAHAGIFDGFADGSFRPGQGLHVGEMLKTGFETSSLDRQFSYTVTPWWAMVHAFAVSEGYPAGDGGALVTRREAIRFLFWMHEKGWL